MSQAWVLQSWFLMLSAANGHATPPLAAGMTIVRVANWVPPLHDAEHGEKALQALIKQSTLGAGVGVGGTVGHTSPVHGRDSDHEDTGGQATPPFMAGWITDMVRDCVPAPHWFEQVDHAPNTLIMQFCTTSHICVLHVRERVVTDGHGVPPLEAGCKIAKVDCWVPPPHKALHALYSLHSPVMQFLTGESHN